MSELINFDEWVAELERLGTQEKGKPEGCFSTEELSRAIGRSLTMTLRQMRDAIRQGKIKPVPYRGTDMAGRPCRCVAYRLVKEPKTKEPKRKL